MDQTFLCLSSCSKIWHFIYIIFQRLCTFRFFLFFSLFFFIVYQDCRTTRRCCLPSVSATLTVLNIAVLPASQFNFFILIGGQTSLHTNFTKLFSFLMNEPNFFFSSVIRKISTRFIPAPFFDRSPPLIFRHFSESSHV